VKKILLANYQTGIKSWTKLRLELQSIQEQKFKTSRIPAMGMDAGDKCMHFHQKQTDLT